MRLAMSFKSRQELLVQLIPRYREANHKLKNFLLNEFVASTGYSRKYAIRLLSLKEIPVSKDIKRPRPHYYGPEEQEIIKLAWSATNFIGSKRLAPFLKELVPSLEYHGYLDINDELRARVTSISAATIDRILQHYRKNQNERGISTTKSGTLLKKQISVRTFADWEDNKPGFFEADLVAHCGCSMEGSFLNTLVLTDVTTGWVECLPLLFRSQDSVIKALEQARQLIPFPILGLDTDNGSEFINQQLITYCDQNKITFTRGRAYKKNDQCFVEQKNGVVVRQLVGYDRFEGLRAYQQLNELYRAVRLYVNFFQPSMRLQIKHREGYKVHRIYDTAKTPYHRLLDEDILAQINRQRLEKIFKALDPIKLLQQIKSMQDALWQLAVTKIGEEEKSKAGQHIPFSPNTCGLSEYDNMHSIATDFLNNSIQQETRKYRRTKKPRVPHYWRTRKDPFVEVWDEICSWLEKHPERTSKSLFDDLQQRYPDQFKDSQLRTLQRRVKEWRSKALLTFNYNWIKDELLVDDDFTTELQGKIIHEAVF